VVVGLALGLCAPSVAAACSLPAPGKPPPPASALIKDYDVAVYGVVSYFHVLPRTAPPGQALPGERPFTATVRVTRVFKGSARRTIRLAGVTGGATCGYGSVMAGQRVALRLDRPSNPYAVSALSRVTLRGLLAATDGRWHRPVGP